MDNPLTITTPQSSGVSHEFTMRQVDACPLVVKDSGRNLNSKSTIMLRPRQDYRAMFMRDTSL